MARALAIDHRDNVATLMEAVSRDEVISVDIAGQEIKMKLVALEDIDFGHKVALSDIPPGQPVVKYGETIGVANKYIRKGQHVHVHNTESLRGRGDKEA